MQPVLNCFPEVCIPVLASSVHPAHSNSSMVLQIEAEDEMAEDEMMEDTKKTWTLDPPKDQVGIYKRRIIVQRPGDVMYLPPGWFHQVSLSLSPLPLCLSMSLYVLAGEDLWRAHEGQQG